ncbi:hypothetical protein NEOLEDRAFT_1245594 [Neolentinus lepideus HHB14362 ss-1]|uniref:Uncharacterized protein n=1 Tax=Neolentinus lepideus HHB14362 ss-1 TaxID=1314782 RepID=A0A165NMW4_9AGAM|nr:hypothetical protein NEOLEDRAFT_1245594 [Neolentinus lepideus HHB14362 ss-1]
MAEYHTVLSKSALQERLQALGAPYVSGEDLERLNKGHSGDALTFLLEHMVGRSVARESRDQLYHFQDGERGSSLRAPRINTSLMDVKNAQSSFIGAKKDVEELHESLNKRHKSLADLQHEASILKERIRDKQAVDLLLSVLEKKSAIRTQRLKEVTRLLERLKNGANEQPIKVPSIISDDRTTYDISYQAMLIPSTAVSKVSDPAPQTSYTRDTLAVLRARHIRRSSCDLQKGKENAQAKLRRCIAGVLQCPEDDDEVHLTLERIVRSAKTRAARKLKPHEVLSQVSTVQAVKLVTELSVKQAKLQRLSDTTVALTHLSAQHVSNILTFVNSTSQALRTSLDTEAKAVQGHIEILQWDIFAQDKVRSETSTFQAELCSVLGLAQHTAPKKILEAVDTLVSEEQRRQTFLEHTILPDPASFQTESDGALLLKHKNDERKVEEQLFKLLTRKIEKAKKGDVLVKDIETTTREMNRITSLSR